MNIDEIKKVRTLSEYISFLKENGFEQFVEMIKYQGRLINCYTGEIKPKDVKLIDSISDYINSTCDVSDE